MRRALYLSFLFIACSDDPDKVGIVGDGGAADGGPPSTKDASSTEDATTETDAGSDAGPGGQDAGPGETCIGYGAGETCAMESGKPYGYVCFGGPPPGITGCKETRQSSTLGNNYCCSQNACVEQIDQSAQCNGVSGKPHRFQCPPTNADGGTATPPAGCEEHNSGSSAVETYYCCP